MTNGLLPCATLKNDQEFAGNRWSTPVLPLPPSRVHAGHHFQPSQPLQKPDIGHLLRELGRGIVKQIENTNSVQVYNVAISMSALTLFMNSVLCRQTRRASHLQSIDGLSRQTALQPRGALATAGLLSEIVQHGHETFSWERWTPQQ